MSYRIETTYRGVVLLLELGATPSAALTINGIVRDRSEVDRPEVTLWVNSTVQTDYEWHEFIEGIAEYRQDTVTARIVANNQELASETFERRETV